MEGMSASEYARWKAIYSVEPFPEERADRRAAQQMVNIRRALGDKGSFSVADFVPDFWGELQPKEQTPAQMKAAMNVIKAASKRDKKRK